MFRQKGFTIVELLIVIVIVGILASLVVVAYNGVQQRANNTARITVAGAYQRIINAYVRQYGATPATTWACLGESSNYTDWDNNGSVDCHRSGNPYHPSAVLISELKKISPTLPAVNGVRIGPGSDGQSYSGLSYNAGQTYDGRSDQVSIYYWLEGANQDCKNTDVYQTYNVTNSDITFCALKVFNPTTQ